MSEGTRVCVCHNYDGRGVCNGVCVCGGMGGYLGCVVEPVDDALHALLVVGHHLVSHAVGVHDLNRGEGGGGIAGENA